MNIDELEIACPKPPSKRQPWQRNRTSSADRTPALTPARGRSVTQMRLDRIWQERSPTAWTEYVHWRREFLARPARFTTARLTVWLAEVERDLELVGEPVRQPPAHWTGERWDQAHEMLLRLQGQRQAVTQTLAERAGSTSARGLKPST